MFEIHRHDALDSTSSEAARRVRDGRARHGEVHVARTQTSGRGRQGRVWHSAPGDGLYTTVVWFLDERPSGAAATMAAGLAVLAAVHAAGVARARLDWPNDVEVDGAKLAGVLIEALEVGGGRVALLVGIGVNVAQRSFPAELVRERPVTSLALCGVAEAGDPVEAALARLLAALGPELARLARAGRDATVAADLCARFARAAGLVDQRVEVRVAVREGERRVVGRFEGLDLARGFLLDGEPAPLALEHVRGVALAP
jgi:BirA family biotin operon repressor/biotin-[acetyl-CoA-carboxylase] ligase